MSRINLQENGWVLSCPAPLTGKIECGYYNSGSGLADDTVTETDEFSIMQIVSDVCERDFESYSRLFDASGYKSVLDNSIGSNLYRQYTDGKKVWHLAYLPHKSQIRVSEDVCGVAVSEFATHCSCSKNGVQPAIYQYGLYYDPNNDVTDRTVNCGMFYVIRLRDNSLILVDGGHIFQASDKTVENMLAFLHKITGTRDGERITVAAWYITHAHGDHVSSTAKLFNRYRSQIELKGVTYNFPSYQVRSRGYDALTTTAKGIVRRLYPDAAFLKLHSGMRFELGGVELEVLYTHEDAVDVDTEMTYNLRDYNCTSTVIRVRFDERSILLLGDVSQAAEAIIVKSYDDDTLRSDAVQVAHHCFNLLESIYGKVKAPIALMPNSYYGCHRPENLPKLDRVLEHVKNGQIYYESGNTVGLAVENGTLAVILDEPAFAEEYDFSGF